MTEENRKAFGTCKRYADAFDMMIPSKGRDGKVEPRRKSETGFSSSEGMGPAKPTWPHP